MNGALTLRDLDDDHLDALVVAIGRAQAGEDAVDFHTVDRRSGTISIAGDFDIIFDALNAMEREESCRVPEEACVVAHDRLHDEFMEVFRG